MGHFEIRRCPSIQRHLILTRASHLHFAEFRLEVGGMGEGVTIAHPQTAKKDAHAWCVRGRRRTRRRAGTIAA
jgi:hypothetical protein